ncbi:capsular polysaccharide biosynthesis protein putative tyrosine-protein kinase [Coprobacillus sp. CAG:605]|nr:capsular polysaccharide biosynthesis protein putative tyrosine-protein kinase [Coprobacillus sp. CAG:605]
MNELIVATNPKSSIAEAIKTIRTNLQFSSVDDKVKSILVTSSFSGEGKSFVTSNLAVAFAQAGTKVLIVDCDLRRGRQHNIFHVENLEGLSNLLIDDVEKKYKHYIKKTRYENIYVLPMGIVPPNPSELLASDKNKQLVGILAKNYDLVIYDGVPVGGLTDSIIMADLVDKIVIVSAYKQTPIELLNNTKKNLEKFSDKIAGVVLNKYPATKDHYYSNYYYKADK